MQQKSDVLYEYSSLTFSSYTKINVSTTVHLQKKKTLTNLINQFVNLKYDIYYTGTDTDKLLLIKCHYYNTPMFIIQKILHLSRETSPHFDKKESQPLYTPITTL